MMRFNNSTAIAMCCLAALFCRGGSLDPKTESLIDQLPQTAQIGFGYSAQFSGVQFLPVTNVYEVGTLVLGSQPPQRSEVLKSIVERGALAVFSLLRHLDDARETKIPPISGMMWMSFADEYDFNHRTRKASPSGVNRDTFPVSRPSSHIITVGDLCFVALGQIVNRSFNATRYQPSGGVVVSSPTYSKRLCTVVRADYRNLTQGRHRELLIQDFENPDSEQRLDGACVRLGFYYPEALEPLALKQLAVPTYDIFKINDFVRDALYREPSQQRRKVMFNEFIRSNGPAFSDGIELQLFEDLDSEEADEQHRVSPPLKEKYDARALLIQLYKFDTSVSSTDKPYVATWNSAELARFIRAIGDYRSFKVDRAIHDIFSKITDDDYLAVSCMNRLMGKGYDGEIRRFCQRRIPQSKYEADELRGVLSRANSKHFR